MSTTNKIIPKKMFMRYLEDSGCVGEKPFSKTGRNMM